MKHRTLLGLFLSLLGGVSALNVEVKSGTSECFILQMEKSAACSGNFEIIEEENQLIGITIIGPKPSSTVYFETIGQAEGNFQFEAASTGDQTLCFSNQGDKDAPIGFAFREDAADLISDGDSAVATEENIVSMIEVGKDLSQGLDMLLDHQQYMRMREEHHRSAVQGTNSKVLWWTLVEAAILVSMSIWQILYIRKFFEVKRYV
uniref:GOLD domain-containing protein n=1 Tax=Octactis speculum TaxID=3111310 RepID=A0A7S2DBK6_9STRA